MRTCLKHGCGRMTSFNEAFCRGHQENGKAQEI